MIWLRGLYLGGSRFRLSQGVRGGILGALVRRFLLMKLGRQHSTQNWIVETSAAS